MQDILIKHMKDYADEYNVPIVTDEGIGFIRNFIKHNKIKRILEIGTAIGYSTILMADVDDDITITSIERDEKRYMEAINNIKKAHMDKRINLLFKDALDVELDDNFDLIFIDAAKAQNIKFFEKFTPLLNKKGYVITDNMSFHGLVETDESKIESRNVRQLVRKVKKYKEYLKENCKYETKFLEIGDGLAISEKM